MAQKILGIFNSPFLNHCTTSKSKVLEYLVLEVFTSEVLQKQFLDYLSPFESGEETDDVS